MSKENIEDREYTHEEYDQLLEGADYKYEYHAGRIRAMAGARPNHNRAQIDLAIMLANAFAGSDCNVFGSDQAIDVEELSLIHI